MSSEYSEFRSPWVLKRVLRAPIENMEDETLLLQKYSVVKQKITKYRRVMVAFSGGVDSTLLIKIARDTLGKEPILAITADSPSLAREDLNEARDLAKVLDVEHLIVPTHEVSDPSYRVNTDKRCFFCKQHLFQELDIIAKQRGFPKILYGAIGDDLLSERPGQKAAIEFGIAAPLQEANVTKREVRELSRMLGLPNWNRPQNACLASRVPHGFSVTEEKLRQVEDAEAFLRAQGFRQVRVRHLGRHARIEVEPQELVKFEDPNLCRLVIETFRRLDFSSIGLDQAGYLPGGANKANIQERLLELSSLASY